MQKVKKTVERTIKEQVTVYVANDGTEFKTEAECDYYEATLSREAVLKRDDVRVMHIGPPCDGEHFSYDYEYLWVMPLSYEACEALGKAYESDWCDENSFIVGKWSCIELDFDDMAIGILLDSVMDNIKRQFSLLGYEVEFIERAEGK